MNQPLSFPDEETATHRAVRDQVLKDPSTYFVQFSNVICSLLRMVLIVAVALAASHTLVMMVAVHSYQEVAKQRLADLTLGDLYSGSVMDLVLLFTLILLGFPLVMSAGKIVGFRDVVKERIESKLQSSVPKSGVVGSPLKSPTL